MDNMDSSKIAGISFTDIFGEDSSSISMEKVDAFFRKAIDYTASANKISPNQLVRVVHGKKVMWMTQQQASLYLKDDGESGEMQKDVEKAIRGNLKYIRQELEILLALALYSFSHYKQLNSISPKDIDRIGPSLQRRQSEINEGISQTIEGEAILDSKRRKNPLLGEYEEMMGAFINAKNKGDQASAMQLARQLAEKKKYYLLLARGIEPDIRTIYYHRLNLQKTKKRILSTQGELCSSRLDTLRLEITEIRQNLNSIKDQIRAAEESGQDSAALTIQKLKNYDLSDTEKVLNEKSVEMLAMKTESKIIEKQEAEVDSVIQNIQENVLGETDTKINVTELTKAAAAKKLMTKAPEPAPAADSSSSGKNWKKRNL